MDRHSPEKMEGETNGTLTATATTTITTTAVNVNATTSAIITMTTASATRTQAPPASLCSALPDRQAVQVIQQAIHRPQNMAAQYLQQMYAAQQQHLMLQTLQQQHTPHLQSLATVQQASLTGSRQSSSSPSSSNGGVVQSPGVSQTSVTSITLPGSPVTAQLIGRTQSSSSTATGGTVSQQAMLLGNGSANCNQAQMYLRTQMLILTPATTVAAVQSDLPTVISSTCQPSSSSSSSSSQMSQVHQGQKVQSLAVRTHLPGALATAQSVLIKPSSQAQALVPSLPKMSLCPLKTPQHSDTSTETSRTESRQADVTRLISPTSYSPVQSHALIKHQLHCTPSHKGAHHHHQLIIQQTTGGAHRQLHPIALRVTAQDTSPPPLPLTLQPLTIPTPAIVHSHHRDGLLVSSSSSSSSSEHAPPTHSQQTVVVSSGPPHPTCPSHSSLLPAPLRLGSLPQRPPPLVPPPRLPLSPPASLQRLSLRSVQALAVQSGQMMVTEEELPVAEALVRMPYRNLPPPQTVAVDLKMQPSTRTVEAPSSTQPYKMDGMRREERREESSPSPPRDRTPTPPTRSPSTGPDRHCKDTPAHIKNCTAGLGFACVPSSRSVIRLSEEPSSYVSTTSSPPPLLPGAVRDPGLGPGPGPGQPPPACLPGSPESVRPHILTHLIEGFVIREGLEPFPVVRSSLMADQQATLPEAQEMRANGGPLPEEDSLMDAEQPENSTDSEMDDAPTMDGEMDDTPAVDEPGESLADVLQCEFCGKRGYVHTFLRSKRFCSMTCVRRFNVSCTKRISMLKVDKASRWGHRPMGRRGRPPGRVNGGSREHFLRQVQGSYSPEETQRALRGEGGEGEDEPPVPMITRLQRQAERERERERVQEREREQGQRRREAFSRSDRQEGDLSSPTQWTVEQVFSYINSLPGGRNIAEEFRSQEIDGQALLLLTEDHLMSAMNVKLGPALKLCAHINSLKDP